MRKVVFAALLALAVLQVKAQETEKPSVVKSTFALQFGLVSLGFQNESKIARKWALHSEIGISLNPYTVSAGSSLKDKTEYITSPYFVIEPRFYYGLDRRQRHGKNTSNNSSNYISLKTHFAAADWAITNSDSRFEPASVLYIVPSYGIRRSFAKRFFYEFSFGVGLQHNFHKSGYFYGNDVNEITVDGQAKIGYSF
jgi:hypothetical protein